MGLGPGPGPGPGPGLGLGLGLGPFSGFALSKQSISSIFGVVLRGSLALVSTRRNI